VSNGSQRAGSSAYLTTTAILPVARGTASSAPFAAVTNLKGDYRQANREAMHSKKEGLIDWKRRDEL
jgi:hypothetical protein